MGWTNVFSGFHKVLAAVAAFLVVVMALGAAAPANATDTNQSAAGDQTGTDQPEQSERSEPVDRSLIDIDRATDIAAANWTEEGVFITFNSKIPRMAALTDASALLNADGASRTKPKPVRLSTGTTKVFMKIEPTNGKRVVSIAVGDYIVALRDGGEPLFGEVNESMIWAAGLAGMLAPVLLQMLLIKWRERKLENNLYEVL